MHLLGRLTSNRACAALMVGFLIGGCASSPANDPELAALIPSAFDLGQIATQFGDSGGVGPRVYVDPSLDDRSFAPGRPGPVGGRAVAIGATGSKSPDVSIEVYLFHRPSDAEALQFWKEYPPEQAHRDSSPNVDDVTDSFIRDNLDDWTYSVDVPFPAVGRCLAGPYDFGCSGFHSWVLLCEYAVEVVVQPRGGWPLDDERVVSSVGAITSQIAKQVECS